MPKRYAKGKFAVGECARSGRKMLLKDMVSDGYYPSLVVDPAWYEGKHPQESLPEIEDPVSLWRPAPERDQVNSTFRMPSALLFFGFGQSSPSLDADSGASDPNFADVVLLLHLDGADGATSTVDSSLSAHAMVFADDAELTTDQVKFGTASLGVNNSTLPDQVDDSLYTSIGASTDFDFASGLWTIELQYRADESAGANALLTIGNSSGGTEALSVILSNGNIGLELNSAAAVNVFTVPHVNATWHHLALQRKAGDTFECFLDGVESSSGDWVSATAINDPVGDVILGGSGDGPTPGQPFEGYIDEVRITKGVARYTGNFTPPTAAYPNS